MYLYTHMYVLLCVYTYTYRPSCTQHECNACAHEHIVPLFNTLIMHARAHTHAYPSHSRSYSYSFFLAPSFFLRTLSLSCSVYLVFPPLSLARTRAFSLCLSLSLSPFLARALPSLYLSLTGGVPICWPQFGPGDIQQHGFARNLKWYIIIYPHDIYVSVCMCVRLNMCM